MKDNSELVDMVMRTAPGTTVPVEGHPQQEAVTLNVKVEELISTPEQQTVASSGPDAASGNRRSEPTGHGFGMHVRADHAGDRAARPACRPARAARRQRGRAASARPRRGGMAPGDVILAINDKDVRERRAT